MTLAANAKGVCLNDGDNIVCLNRANGQAKWTSPPLPRNRRLESNFGACLVVHDDVVLFAGGAAANDTLMPAVSIDDGTVLWNAKHPRSGYKSPKDLLVADGLVWTGDTMHGNSSGTFTGRDSKTGEVRVEFPPDVKTYWFHHRCHRGKATNNYLLMF